MDWRSAFETDLPIIQAPMAGAQLSALAIATSRAGALGSLPGAMLSLDALRDELRLMRSGTTHAWNVNFFCHTPPEPDAERERRWRKALLPYYREFGIDPDAATPPPSRAPFSHDAADVLAEVRPAIVSFTSACRRPI